MAKIYLAGKITKNGWRNELIPDLIDWYHALPHWPDYWSNEYNPHREKWPILEGVLSGHDYTGPYFIGCDHGCYHGDNSHGYGLGKKAYCVGDGFSTSRTVQLCQSAIKISDIVFAWIDADDCYGTIAEIGYAKALGKKIIIAGPQEYSDMWFIYRMADHTWLDASIPEQAFSLFIPAVKPRINYYEYIKSAKWREKANAAKSAAGWRCSVCNKSKDDGIVLHAHHRTYERLGDELPEDITVLCADCHRLYHENEKKNGKK